MIANLAEEIINRLKEIDPYKVILFGSCAYGNPNENSDIDLYVVTKYNYIPKSYRENMDHYLKVSRYLRDLKQNYSIDLIVHTLAMYKKFIELQSSFSKTILSQGRTLISSSVSEFTMR